MKKQIFFLAVFFCLISFNLTGQNKYNDLMAKQLKGAVKEVTTVRKLHGGVDWGDSDSKWSTLFDNRGYITKSEDYIYKWNANYTQCSCEVPRVSGERYYDFFKANVSIANNVYKYEGKMTQYQGTDNNVKGNGVLLIEYHFDTSGRLLKVVNGVSGMNFCSLLTTSMYQCNKQDFSYKGVERLPYKVVNDMEDGGESWGIEFLIKYEKFDSQGNWLYRKLYNVEDSKKFVEEIRTITYYSETNSSSPAHSSVQQNKVPVFIGGQTAMKKFFADNANPRKPAIATAGYGEVIVEFTVTESGEVANAKLKGRVSASMDEEALRLVNMMPKWNPGLIDGQPARMKVQVGLRFFPNQEFRYIKTILN